jgi:hypothetical protein
MNGELAMKTRIFGPLALALLAGGISSPVLADCCSSFLSCAATVVTEGVSCEVQTIIDTILALKTEVNNFGNDITGITSEQEQGARLYVSNKINTLRSQSQQSDADLAAALSQATTIYTDEKTIIEYKDTTANTQNLQATSPTSASGPPHAAIAQIAGEKTPGSAPHSTMAQRSQDITPAPVSGNSMPQKSTISSAAQISPSAELVAPPHGTYTDAFLQGQKQIAVLKAAGDSYLSTVNQDLAQAQSSEGPGVAAADTVVGALESPVTAIVSQLTSMLAHPLDAFDPSSMVDDMEKTITTAMSSNIPLMIADITTGPDQNCDAAKFVYDDLLLNAEQAQAIATAMDRLYKLRTPGAAEALYALLPKVEYAGVTSKATVRAATATFGQRQSYAIVAANSAAAKQKLLVVVTPPSLAKIHTLIVQFKAQRAQGKASLPQSALVAYKSNFSGQLNSLFNSKSSAALAAQRDQLIAQARTQFAKDPTTENGVIALLNSEAAKRSVLTNTTAAIAPVPGQPVPTLASQAATRSTVPIGVVPPVTTPVSQTKTTAWGTTPAWTPPAAAGAPATTVAAPSTFKATTTLKAVQPVQTQQPALQAAPSSLAR